MKNQFTQLTNKFTLTLDNVRQIIFRQRKKDTGTKKETARSTGGGGHTVPAHVTDTAIKTLDKYQYKRKTCNVKSVLVRRKRNKISARSRRINRIKRQHGKAA